jgi:ribosomal subunit interface protein
MRVQFVTRNVSASDSLREHIEQQLARLTQVYPGIGEAIVTLTQEGTQQNTEIHVHVRGKRFHCSESAELFEQSAEQCVSSLRRSLLRYKDRKRTHDPQHVAWR